MRLSATVALAVTVSLAAPAALVSARQPKRSGDLGLVLDCSFKGQIQFELANRGNTDTTVVPGSVIGNGRTYTIDALQLVVKAASGSQSVFRYSPRRYPVAIGGALGEWHQLVPAHTVLRIAAAPDDFLSNTTRLSSWEPGGELSLRWTLRDPGSDAMLLVFWSGTLESNSCRPS